jgi:hypothetical protein
MRGWIVVATFVACLASSLVNPVRAQDPQPLGDDFRVNTYTTGSQRNPAVAMDGNGDFVVVWESKNQDNPGFQDYGVFGQRFDATPSTVGDEFLVNTYTSFHQMRSAVSMDAAGNFVVVWQSSFQEGGAVNADGIFGQRFAADGTPTGDEFRVNVFAPEAQERPDIASSPNGDFVVVWESDRQEHPVARDGIYGRQFLADGTPGSEFHVNTYITQDQARPAAAMDADGDFVVVWTSYSGQDGDLGGIFGQRFDSDGTPNGDEFLVNTTTTGWQDVPDVAMDAEGNFLVAWGDTAGLDGDGQGIFGQRFLADGDPVGGEFQVNTYTTSNQYYPAVASDSNGSFVVVWQSYFAPIARADVIVGQLFADTGAPVGGEFQVNSFTPGFQRYPQIATGGTGLFIVAWDGSNDGSLNGAFSRLFQIEPIFADGFESGDTSLWSSESP